jgi:hypothetical protein
VRIQISDKTKKALVKKYWRLTRKVFIKMRAELTNMAEHTDPDRLKNYVRDRLQVNVMKDLIDNLWSEVGGKAGYDTVRMIKRSKSGSHSLELKEEDQLTLWKERMRHYSAERSLQKAAAILDSEVEAINGVIDSVLDQSLSSGMGIPETRRLMRESLDSELVTIENWQAQRIAMTEVGSAQNTASFEGAQENAEGVLKEWMFIPGLKTFRENHQGFEAMGPQEMDFDYADGLKFPGDPDCNDPGEVINCYCSIIYTTEN